MRSEDIKKLEGYPIADGEVINVEWTEHGGEPIPNPLGLRFEGVLRFYKVMMKLHPARKSNIKVVMYLPEAKDWNGKFLGTGNGGSAGEIAEGALMNGVCRGYAVANTDMGTSKDPDDDYGNQEVIKDFGYRATHLMTVVGKGLTSWFYGEEPRYSYFLGGSTGGQQGFSEVQRYPEDYDGVICLSPAFDRVRLHSFFVWNWQQLHKESNSVFTPELAKQWKDCIVSEYGEMCGSSMNDEFLTFPGRIKENPMDNPNLRQKAAELFTQMQKKSLQNLYDGPKDPLTGAPVIVPFLPGTEAESLSLVDIGCKDKFAHDFFYLFRWIWRKDYDFMKFDFHEDLIDAVRQLSPVLDATNPDLHDFMERGGKLLVIGGSMDAIIPYKGFIDYYKKVIKELGEIDKVREFLRFFLMPGFAHTVGGSGVQDVGMTGASVTPRDPEHDVLCAMEQWVEKGIAPERILGTHFKMGMAGLQFDYDRPAYAYPYIADFTGGDPNQSANYQPMKDADAY
ncbi:tannase/feruloyl esterase family alpha/beta hydrolase [Robinsoniella peoriensis]